MSDPYWAVCQTRLHGESLALRNLRRQNYKAFYPFFLLPHPRSGLLKVAPVFPNYCFVEIGEDTRWSPINSTLGVKKILTRTGRDEYKRPAAAVFLDGLYRWRRRDGAGASLLPVGTTVRIRRGVFAEKIALVEMATAERVKLLLDVFSGRQVVVDVDIADVQVVRKSAAA
jgi:transcriptional antiterminator RfaH